MSRGPKFKMSIIEVAQKKQMTKEILIVQYVLSIIKQVPEMNKFDV